MPEISAGEESSLLVAEISRAFGYYRCVPRHLHLEHACLLNINKQTEIKS